MTEQTDWFVREVKRCIEIGMPLGCCGDWPECAHVLAWVESKDAPASKRGVGNGPVAGRFVVNPCACGHDHISDIDGADAGCRVCECTTWTGDACK